MSAPHTHINYKLFSELLTAAEKECVIALWCYQYSEFRYNADWKSIAAAIHAPDEKAARFTLWKIHKKLADNGAVTRLPTTHRSSNTSDVVQTRTEDTSADRYQTDLAKKRKRGGEIDARTTHSVTDVESPGLGLGGPVGNPGDPISYHTGPGASVGGPVACSGGFAGNGSGSTNSYGVHVASPAASTMGPPPQRRSGSSNAGRGLDNGLAASPTDAGRSSVASFSTMPVNATVVDLDGYDVAPAASRKGPAAHAINTQSSTSAENNGYNNGYSIASPNPGTSSRAQLLDTSAGVSPMSSNGYHAAPTGPEMYQATQFSHAPANGLTEAPQFQQWYYGPHHLGPAHGDVPSMMHTYTLQSPHQQPGFAPQGYGHQFNPYQQQPNQQHQH